MQAGGRGRVYRRRRMWYGRNMKWERIASLEQIAALAALAREIWTTHYTPIIGAAQVEYMLEKFQSAEALARQIADEGYEYYWVPDAGYLALAPDMAEKSVLLSKIYVKEDRRGTGLGRAMVEFAEARAAELGCVPVEAGVASALRVLAAAISARSIVEIGTGAHIVSCGEALALLARKRDTVAALIAEAQDRKVRIEALIAELEASRAAQAASGGEKPETSR